MTKNNAVVKRDAAVVMSDIVINNDSVIKNDLVAKVAVDGLIIKGSVTGRTRRIVGDKNIELITYKIAAGDNIYFVKDWAPKDYFPVGKFIELPITIKSYQTNGRVRIDFTICNNSSLGEEF